MKRTVRIPIKIDRSEDLLATMKVYGEIFNLHVDWAFKNQTYNKNKAHHALYHQIREQYPQFPSVFVQTARDQALESIKASKFKHRPFKRKYSSLRHTPRSFDLRGKVLTFSCIGKRIKTTVSIPQPYQWLLHAGKVCGSTVSFDGHRFWVNLVFDLPTPPKIENTTCLGIDRGIYNLAVTSDDERYSSSKLRANQRRYLHNRKTLQAKGTRSAKRRLKSMKGREMRFSRDVNHCITKQISLKDVGVFVLEDLTGIRRQRKGKKMNKWLGSWPFYQFELFLGYKAEALGKSVVYVNPYKTSQRCNCCGYENKSSRAGNRFKCGRCGYEAHADLNAANNIRDRYLLALASKAGCCQSAECSCGSS